MLPVYDLSLMTDAEAQYFSEQHHLPVSFIKMANKDGCLTRSGVFGNMDVLKYIKYHFDIGDLETAFELNVRSTHEPYFDDQIDAYSGPKRIAFDIGASLGKYSARLIECGFEHVYAFEPNIGAIAFIDLMAQHRYKSRNCIHPIPKAIADRTGPIPFYVPTKDQSIRTALDTCYIGHTANPQFARSLDDNLEEVTIEAITLDAFCQEIGAIPDLIKMDIEGAEDTAWDGAINIIGREGITILLEVHNFRRLRRVDCILS
jgi:FkbM family methyltransferase